MSDYEIADIIWRKIKGKPVEKDLSDEEYQKIIRRYWHRTIEHA
jgi:hypothetical protein